jgi:hypothetical protein
MATRTWLVLNVSDICWRNERTLEGTVTIRYTHSHLGSKVSAVGEIGRRLLQSRYSRAQITATITESVTNWPLTDRVR